jgi:16S rRNA (cytosine1402-N4)-methyltransferase
VSAALYVENTMTFVHEPVLLSQVLDLARAADPELIVDCTLGGAGHARALLAALPRARLIGIDRDPAAVAAASAALADVGARATVVHGRFSNVREALAGSRCGFLLADLGVSSHQLDTPERGFSFRARGPLDMRMDNTSGPTAAEVIAEVDEGTLAAAIKEYGEERHAKRVARAVAHDRPTTTDELAAIVRRVVPRSKDGIDQATRTFQALRMLVNRELDEVRALLAVLPEILADNGVAAVISFHSLEDRAVKIALRDAQHGCVCPPSLPVCVCGFKPTLEVLTSKPMVASADEVRDNPRARSAKLRAARRLPRSA